MSRLCSGTFADSPLPEVTSSGVPTRHQLDAALRVVTLLTTSDQAIDRVRAGYEHIPTDGLLARDDLVEGEELLIAVGLAGRRDDYLRLVKDLPYARTQDREAARELLLIDILTAQRPPWLAVATATGEVRPALLPEEVSANLASVITDFERREAVLLTLGQTYDPTAAERIGALGELHCVAECKRTLLEAGMGHLVDRVARVSQVSDALGYDITTPTISGALRHLEVKTLGASRSEVRIFLSRNEYRVARSDDRWRLVVCRVISESEAETIGWCRSDALHVIVPTDSPLGRWTEARLDVSHGDLQPGLPLGTDQ